MMTGLRSHSAAVDVAQNAEVDLADRPASYPRCVTSYLSARFCV